MNSGLVRSRDQTGIGACHSKDSWRTAISDFGMPVSFWVKNGLWRTCGANTGLTKRADSDVVFSVTSSLVGYVGNVLSSNGKCLQDYSYGLESQGEKHQNLAKSGRVRASQDIFF